MVTIINVIRYIFAHGIFHGVSPIRIPNLLKISQKSVLLKIEWELPANDRCSLAKSVAERQPGVCRRICFTRANWSLKGVVQELGESF